MYVQHFLLLCGTLVETAYGEAQLVHSSTHPIYRLSPLFGLEESQATPPAQGQPNSEEETEREDSERIKELKEHMAHLREELERSEREYNAEKQKVNSLLALMDRDKHNHDDTYSADLKSMEECNKNLKAKLEVSRRAHPRIKR